MNILTLFFSDVIYGNGKACSAKNTGLIENEIKYKILAEAWPGDQTVCLVGPFLFGLLALSEMLPLLTLNL